MDNENVMTPYDSDSDPAWDAVGFGEEVDGWEADDYYEEEPSEDLVPEADQPTDEPEKSEEAEDADQWLELKHMDDPVRKVSKEEAKALAQKGLDYDRIRGERDTMSARVKEMEEFLSEMKGDFDTIDDLMDDTRARLLAEKEEISYNAALARVKSAKKTTQQPADDNPAVAAFVKKFPGVKAEDIPAEVWEEVRITGDLVGAYEKHQSNNTKSKDARIKQLEEELETLKNNKMNESRSTGSSKSRGNSPRASMIASMWNEDD